MNGSTASSPSVHLDRAYVLLSLLDQQARHERRYGAACVQIDYKNGIPTRVRHYSEGVELSQEVGEAAKLGKSSRG